MPALDGRLLNEFQRDFPLVPRPYQALALRLGVSENEVIAALARLIAQGCVSRVGATFVPGRIGAATLAAIAVPPQRLLQVAELVSSFPEVNHNYEREHHFNLWFVITAPDKQQVDTVVRDIECSARCGRVLSLPMVEPYYLDLGFDVSGSNAATGRNGRGQELNAQRTNVPLAPGERALVSSLQEGLPLTSAPYAELALRAGTTEAAVLATLKRWLDARVINRLGVIVRHHELGYHANAMVVWDVPNAEVRAVGRRVAMTPFVTLCYRRLRYPPDWRYNLYCMIHGKDRNEGLAQIAALRANCNLVRYPFEVLFSRQRFKQRGARYLPAAAEAVTHG
jgi:DNA-binding Lrp family transcriptional regulator